MPYAPLTHSQRMGRTKDRRPSAAKRGYDRTWQRLRLMVLARDPICRWHEGCKEPSTESDHIVPKRQGGRNTMENLQGLCKRHHNMKRALEDGA